MEGIEARWPAGKNKDLRRKGEAAEDENRTIQLNNNKSV